MPAPMDISGDLSGKQQLGGFRGGGFKSGMFLVNKSNTLNNIILLVAIFLFFKFYKKR